jgi:hypothetical protein
MRCSIRRGSRAAGGAAWSRLSLWNSTRQSPSASWVQTEVYSALFYFQRACVFGRVSSYQR